MAKDRTVLMHDDLGIVTGPEGYQRFDTLTELLSAVGDSPVCLVISSPIDVTASVTVGTKVNFVFMSDGYLNVHAGVTLTIGGNVWAHAGMYVFRGNGTVVISDECEKFVHPSWWGEDGGWRAGCLTGPVSIDDCEILTVCGGYMTGPLYLSRHPLGDFEAATKKYVDDLVYGDTGSFPYYASAEFTDEYGGAVLLEALRPADRLSIHFCGLVVEPKEIDQLLDIGDTGNGAPPAVGTPQEDLVVWFEDLYDANAPESYAYISNFEDPGVQIGCTAPP